MDYFQTWLFCQHECGSLKNNTYFNCNGSLDLTFENVVAKIWKNILKNSKETSEYKRTCVIYTLRDKHVFLKFGFLAVCLVELCRRARISPCALMMGILYAERLAQSNPNYLKKVSPSDLFIVSMVCLRLLGLRLLL